MRAPSRDRRRRSPRTEGDEAPDADLTWIWSTPRSGAALLLELLAYPLRPDPQAALGLRPPPAAAGFDPSIVPVDEFGFGAHVAPWQGEVVAVGDRWLPGTFLTLNQDRPPYVLAEVASQTWEPPLRELAITRLESIRDRAAAHVRGLSARSPIIVKEAFTSHAADRVMGLLPEARALFVVRDPRDCVCSQLASPDTFDPDGPEPVPEAERGRAAVRAARLWAMSFDVCREAIAVAGDRAMRIRYEDLAADPAAVLEQIFRWIGVERTPAQIGESVDRSSLGSRPPDRPSREPDLQTPVGAWETDLTESELAAVTEATGSRLASAGYG